MSICSDSQGAKEGDCDCPCENICSFHVPLLAPASNRRDFRVYAPIQSASMVFAALSVPEVRRLLWQLFWQWLPTEAYFGLVLLAATTSSDC